MEMEVLVSTLNTISINNDAILARSVQRRNSIVIR